jgi:hypothetical protein
LQTTKSNEEKNDGKIKKSLTNEWTMQIIRKYAFEDFYILCPKYKYIIKAKISKIYYNFVVIKDF